MFKTLFQAIVCYPAFLATIIEKKKKTLVIRIEKMYYCFSKNS